MIGLGAMFAPMEAMSVSLPTGCNSTGTTASCICSDAVNSISPPCTCKSSSYTAVLNSKATTTTPDGLRTSYQYKVTGSKVGSISDAQMVIPRPLTPGSPTDPTTSDIIVSIGGVTVQKYCESDKNSGINKGNCDGFIAHIPPGGTSGSTTFLNIVGGQRVADGLVTLNFVIGQGSSEICQAVNEAGTQFNTGIVGPGDIGDSFQPKFVTQTTLVANTKCVASLTFDKHGNVIDVSGVVNANGYVPDPNDPSQTNCTVKTMTDPIMVNGNPLKNNTGPHGITFGTGTSTCYGPSIPSPAKCICTALPCP
jgi:hypothetical protein